jgi:hypothetical protein
MKNKPIWDFPVVLIPVPNSQGYHLIRTDTNEKISFVTSQYNLVTHRDAVNMVEKQFKQYGTNAFQSRYNMFGTAMTSMQLNYRIGNKFLIAKDDYNTIISITNGYDRLTKLSLSYGLERMVCTNGMVTTESKFRMSVRHLGDVFESMEAFLKKGEEFVKQSTKEFQRMLKSKPILEPILVTKKEYDIMKDMKLFEQYFDELGKNMYAEFQAYSDFFSNHLIGNKKYKYERNILPNFIKLLDV